MSEQRHEETKQYHGTEPEMEAKLIELLAQGYKITYTYQSTVKLFRRFDGQNDRVQLNVDKPAEGGEA